MHIINMKIHVILYLRDFIVKFLTYAKLLPHFMAIILKKMDCPHRKRRKEKLYEVTKQ